MNSKQAKHIRTIVVKQLKTSYPGWKKLTRKVKKELTRQVLDEVMNVYDYDQSLDMPIEELTGISNQTPQTGVKNLAEMADYIDNFYHDNIFGFGALKKSYPEIYDEELKIIDNLLDDQIINSLISPSNYSAPHRFIKPYQLLRMELLKIIKYPEISYRKFCSDDYFGRDCKQNRRFARLSLSSKIQAHHTELCHFRNSLSFKKVMNLLLYFLHYFYKSGCLENAVIHGIDSSELPSEVKYPLCTVKVGRNKIRIYSDLDCDCGTRRNKRDKSHYVVGYRLHTLTAINPSTGHSFPLISLVGAANHHDSLFLKPLIKLAQAMGIDVKLITADQAYHDSDGSVLQETGVYVVAPASEKTKIPENVLESPVRVLCNNFCEIPMMNLGTSDKGHEFGCAASSGECPIESGCPKSRTIGFDDGYFQPMPLFHAESEQSIAIRKNCERPFNLMKKREGLEQTRVRSQNGVVFRSTLTTIATLLIEMAGLRRKPRKKNTEQMELFAATG